MTRILLRHGLRGGNVKANFLTQIQVRNWTGGCEICRHSAAYVLVICAVQWRFLCV